MKIKLINTFLILNILLISCNKEDAEIDKPADNIDNNNDLINENGTFTDDRDGKTYKWVEFGQDKWMIENLKFAPSTGEFWIYNNDTNNISTFGYLYNWETAKTSIPDGWHIPSQTEWADLMNYFTTNALNYDTIFHAQYGGYNDNGYFKSLNMFGMWWNNEEKDSDNAWVNYISYDYNGLSDSGYGKNLGLSVRCVKD